MRLKMHLATHFGLFSEVLLVAVVKRLVEHRLGNTQTVR